MPEITRESVRNYYTGFGNGEAAIDTESSRFPLDYLLTFLQENVQELIRLVEVMSNPQLTYRPAGVPAGWDSSGDEQHFDALEIVTHVTSGIAFHWWAITRALGHERPQFPKPPEGVTATGKGRTLGAGGWTGIPVEEAVGSLRTMTAAFLGYLEGLPVEAGAATSSLGIFKHLTVHSWVFLDALHVAVHLQQLGGMQDMPDYPA